MVNIASNARKEARMHWYLQPWKKYAVFSGRARRREYWWFALVNMAIYTGLSLASLVQSQVRL